ncbi:hypothetical protein [Streptomyces sp. NPDC091219]|uniref:hypothetical protein n=1 Tax=Streptomyces sp. NPDC091219 TaxID=3155193 RepID=UPI00344FB17A
MTTRLSAACGDGGCTACTTGGQRVGLAAEAEVHRTTRKDVQPPTRPGNHPWTGRSRDGKAQA